MSYATRASSGVLRAIKRVGTTCSYTLPNPTWATDGGVTEAAVTHTAVPCTDLLDESRRYMPDASGKVASGTFYLPAQAISFTPSTGHRITYQGRKYGVVAVFPYRIQGSFVAWRLDVDDQGAA